MKRRVEWEGYVFETEDEFKEELKMYINDYKEESENDETGLYDILTDWFDDRIIEKNSGIDSECLTALKVVLQPNGEYTLIFDGEEPHEDVDTSIVVDDDEDIEMFKKEKDAYKNNYKVELDY